MATHKIPEGDGYPHVLSPTCPCWPTVRMSRAGRRRVEHHTPPPTATQLEQEASDAATVR